MKALVGAYNQEKALEVGEGSFKALLATGHQSRAVVTTTDQRPPYPWSLQAPRAQPSDKPERILEPTNFLPQTFKIRRTERDFGAFNNI